MSKAKPAIFGNALNNEHPPVTKEVKVEKEKRVRGAYFVDASTNLQFKVYLAKNGLTAQECIEGFIKKTVAEAK